MTSADPERTERTFEAVLSRLAAVVAELEEGELPLERSLALFEEGVRLAREGQSRLDAAEARVDELLGDRTRPLATADALGRGADADREEKKEPR